MKVVKKVLIAILVLIVALVACYYTFPEKVAVYMMDAARSKAGLTKKEIKIDDHNIVYLEGGNGPTILLLHGYTGSREIVKCCLWENIIAYPNPFRNSSRLIHYFTVDKFNSFNDLANKMMAPDPLPGLLRFQGQFENHGQRCQS